MEHHLDTTAETEMAMTERTRAALRVSEMRYRRLFETAQDGILLLNAETGQIEDVNPYLVNMLGYSHEEFLGKNLWEVGLFADVGHSQEMFRELKEKGYVRYDDLPLKTVFGAKVAVEFVSNSYSCDDVTVIQCNIRNITDRRSGEEEALRLARLYAALSACNKAIVHSKTATELFASVTQIAVRFGGMKLASVGLIDPLTQRVISAGAHGATKEIYNELMISADDGSPYGQGPTGTCIRDRLPVWCLDIQAAPGMAAWKARAEEYGLVACAALPLFTNGAVVGAFTVLADRPQAFEYHTRALLSEMASDISYAFDNFDRQAREDQSVATLKAAYRGTIEVASMLSELRDPYTAGHERRVAAIAVAIGRELGCNAEQIDLLHVAGCLHDIGKIVVPLEILSKPGMLSAIEMQLVKGHAEAGFLVLSAARFQGPVALIAQQHHERADGSGYPLGLKNDEILLESRIMAVADVVEAMSSHRPYRTALGIDAALAEISRGRGTAYDFRVADACQRIFTEQHFQIPT